MLALAESSPIDIFVEMFLMVGSFFGSLFDSLTTSPAFVGLFKTSGVLRCVISVVFLIGLVCWRVYLSNLLYVKRNDTRDWIVFGVAAFFASFFSLPFIKEEIWIVALAVIAAFVGVWTLFIKAKHESKVRDIIQSFSIVEKKDSEKGGFSESVKKNLVFSIKKLFLGVPVFAIKYRFPFSPTASEENVNRCIMQLTKYYPEYDWMQRRAKNMRDYEIIADPKAPGGKKAAVLFDTEISDQLPWYMIPIGVTDWSSKEKAQKTTYVWKLHDPDDDYPCLSEAVSMPSSPQCFVIGSTGGGKSVLVNTMIAHLVNKTPDVNLFLADAKRSEFRPYESLKEVQGVAVTLDEALELSTDFRKQMLDRNKVLEKEGLKSVPLSGHVKLRRHIDINGHIIYGSEILDFKTEDGKIHRDRAMNLDGGEWKGQKIIEVNIPEEKEEEEEEEEGMEYERRRFQR